MPTCYTMQSLAGLYRKIGRYDEAIIMYLTAYSCVANVHDDDIDLYMAITLCELSSLFLSLLMYDEAEHYGKQALDIIKWSTGEKVCTERRML
mmetsp:Transcript_26076/g.42754  ORF Transcript_26076/g.42754 Transcript_26076/m.42754 type:complete len:93 (+) Transcript_26076:849-1127(+)